MSSTYMQLRNNLNYLKLSQMNENLDEILDYITKNNLSLTEGLIKLTQIEIDHREKNMIKSMVKVGAFPHHKELRDFDFDFQSSINKQQILDFETLRFIENCENIVFLGNSGVGNTYFIKCHDLIQQLKKANNENRLEDRLRHFTKYKVLIIDELGYLPINKDDAKLFFQLIDRRYEKRSTILTTNINFSEWDEVFCDAVMANAILDRVLHHAHVVTITGKSYRLKDHMKPNEEES